MPHGFKFFRSSKESNDADLILTSFISKREHRDTA